MSEILIEGSVMNYVLKNEKEAERLKRQSEAKAFDVSEELRMVDVKKGASVLEIGCGAGTLISHLNDQYKVKASGCDLQEDHIKFCQQNCSDQIEFFQHNIVDSSLTQKYDYIFMRYMTHHLGVDLLLKAMENVKNALNPGGQVVIIDIDGLFENLGSLNQDLLNYLDLIDREFIGSLIMGRKIPTILEQAQLNDIRYEVQTIDFRGEERRIEIQQMKERFTFAKDALIEILGSELEFQRFYKLFMSEISKDAIPYFINKFITIGKI